MSARLSPFTSHIFWSEGFKYPHPQIATGTHEIREMATAQVLIAANDGLQAASALTCHQTQGVIAMLRNELKRRRWHGSEYGITTNLLTKGTVTGREMRF